MVEAKVTLTEAVISESLKRGKSQVGETGDGEQTSERKPKGSRAPWRDTRRNRADNSGAKEFRPDGNGRAAQHEGD